MPVAEFGSCSEGRTANHAFTRSILVHLNPLANSRFSAPLSRKQWILIRQPSPCQVPYARTRFPPREVHRPFLKSFRWFVPISPFPLSHSQADRLDHNPIVAENPYYKRDFRRAFPKTEVVTQGELAKLLIAQGGFQACVLYLFTRLTSSILTFLPIAVSLLFQLLKVPKLPQSLPIPPPPLSQLSTLRLPSLVDPSNLLLLPVPNSGTFHNEENRVLLQSWQGFCRWNCTDGHLPRKMLLMIPILTSPCTSPTLLKLNTKGVDLREGSIDEVLCVFDGSTAIFAFSFVFLSSPAVVLSILRETTRF